MTFTRKQLVQSLRVFDSSTVSSTVQVADLARHRFECEPEAGTEYSAHCGNKSDFEGLVGFAAHSLWLVDGNHDGPIFASVAENADCISITLDEFELFVAGVIGRLRGEPPEFLALRQTYRVAIRVYGGWLDHPDAHFNLRKSIVWEAGGRFCSLHTRSCV